LCIGIWLCAAPASATDFDQFQNARAAYESLNYELAADLFRGLLADAAPGDRRPLIIESRKYLAASYLFLGREAEAVTEFRALLEVEPEYVLDPLGFPQEVQRVFVQAKIAFAEQRRVEAERAEREAQAARRDAERARTMQRERLTRLIELARIERTTEVHSRAAGLIPFGVGQFQNGHDDLGLALAISEGALLVASLTAYALHENLRGQDPAADQREDARLAEGAFRYTNYITLGLFAALAITGVIDAQVRFRETRVIERRRELPPELERIGQRAQTAPAPDAALLRF
jgi:tetratricopeptide (TPR) repeat protein